MIQTVHLQHLSPAPLPLIYSLLGRCEPYWQQSYCAANLNHPPAFLNCCFGLFDHGISLGKHHPNLPSVSNLGRGKESGKHICLHHVLDHFIGLDMIWNKKYLFVFSCPGGGKWHLRQKYCNKRYHSHWQNELHFCKLQDGLTVNEDEIGSMICCGIIVICYNSRAELVLE